MSTERTDMDMTDSNSPRSDNWYLEDVAHVAPSVAARYRLSPLRAARLWQAYLVASPTASAPKEA